MKTQRLVLLFILLGSGIIISGCYTTFAASEMRHRATYRTTYSDAYQEAAKDTASGEPGLVLHERYVVEEVCDPGMVVYIHFRPSWQYPYYHHYGWISWWDYPCVCGWWREPWYYRSYGYHYFDPYPYWHYPPHYVYYPTPYHNYPNHGYPVYDSAHPAERRSFDRRSEIPSSNRSRSGSGDSNSNQQRTLAVRDQAAHSRPDQPKERGADRRQPATVQDIRHDLPDERRITDRRTNYTANLNSSTTRTERKTIDTRSESPTGSQSRVRENTRQDPSNQQNASSSKVTAVRQRITSVARSVSKSVNRSQSESSRSNGSGTRQTERTTSTKQTQTQTPTQTRSSSGSSRSTPSVSSRSSRPSTSGGSGRSSSSGGSQSSSGSSRQGRR